MAKRANSGSIGWGVMRQGRRLWHGSGVHAPGSEIQGVRAGAKEEVLEAQDEGVQVAAPARGGRV